MSASAVYPVEPIRNRVLIVFEDLVPATAETLLTLTKIVDGTVQTSGVSIGVTPGKRLRIQSLEFNLLSTAAAAAWAILNLRQNPIGDTILTSVKEGVYSLGLTAAAINASLQLVVPFPDGYEFSGTMTLGMSLSAQAITNAANIQLRGYEYTPFAAGAALPAQLL